MERSDRAGRVDKWKQHNVYQLLAQLLVDGDLDEIEWAILDQLMPGWDEPSPAPPYYPHL